MIQGKITYYIGNILDSEKAEIESAIKAIETVYQLVFEPNQNSEEALLVFDQEKPTFPEKEKLYFHFQENHFSRYTNAILINQVREESLGGFANKGQLPERLLEGILPYLGLDQLPITLSKAQIDAKFKVRTIKRPLNRQTHRPFYGCYLF